jgi:hypothetical protein
MQQADELRRYRKAKFGNAGKCATGWRWHDPVRKEVAQGRMSIDVQATNEVVR